MSTEQEPRRGPNHDHNHVDVGITQETQLCPNPYCRAPFNPINNLQELYTHFSSTTRCGRWIQAISTARQDNSNTCPNPACQQVFGTADHCFEHLCQVNTSCNTWLQGQNVEDEHNPFLEDLDIIEDFGEDGDADSQSDNDDNDDLEPDDGDGEALVEDAWHSSSSMDVDSSDRISSPSTIASDNNSYSQHIQAPHTAAPPDPRLRQANVPPGCTVVAYHSHAPIDKPGGLTHFQMMDKGPFGDMRKSNPYYPFASKAEWHLGAWLAGGKLAHVDINAFLKSEFIQQYPLSFTSARELFNRLAQLPPVPKWQYQHISVPSYGTRHPIVLYWRDGLDVVKHLYRNPLFANSIEMTPYRAAEQTSGQRVYGEFMGADYVWDRASSIRSDAGILGVIGASDKTPLTFGTGGKQMHPLLLSIANIRASVRMKASSHAYALAAYLPIPKFKNVSKETQSILSARVYHACVSIVTARLKEADRSGAIFDNPWGGINFLHTPLVSWIADYPEQLMISATTSYNSPLAKAGYHQLESSALQPLRTRSYTLGNIQEACLEAHPSNLPSFFKACKKRQLNGVIHPFWADWGDADPSEFLTTDALHQHHKFFFDHCLQWAINIMSGRELDQRLMLLQPTVGVRSWPDGVSTLKQLTGRDHRALERVLIVVIAGAVPDEVLRAIRALVDFIFLAQNLFHYPDTLNGLDIALQEFHAHKHAIIEAGGRRGKSGIISHFKLPKLESMLHVTRLIKLKGAAYQYTSDITERCHITLVKRPYRASSRVNYHEQCCRFLDREEKIRFFNLYTLFKEHAAAQSTADRVLDNEMNHEATILSSAYPEQEWLSSQAVSDEICYTTRAPAPPLSLRNRGQISSDNTTAYLVTRQPHYTHITVDDAATQFHLPDLRAALADFLGQSTIFERNSRRLSHHNAGLPFQYINIWNSVRVQSRAIQDSRDVAPIQTIQALPPSPTTGLPWGRCNTVLVREANLNCMAESAVQMYSVSAEDTIENSQIQVVQVRAILQPLYPPNNPHSNSFVPGPLLFYGHRFKVKAHRNAHNIMEIKTQPNIDMYLLERRKRPSDGTFMGDIFAVADIRRRVQLVPRYGLRAEPPQDLTGDGSLEFYQEFYLNNFDERETFHAILNYL